MKITVDKKIMATIELTNETEIDIMVFAMGNLHRFADSDEVGDSLLLDSNMKYAVTQEAAISFAATVIKALATK